MPGMGSSLGGSNPTIVSAFHTALLHQLLLLGLVAVAAAVAWNVLRAVQYRKAVADGRPPAPAPAAAVLGPEAPGRRILRVGFGVLWIVDGLLQLQQGMVLGMPSTVLRPAATGSPSWVHHLVATGATIWGDHPVQAAASAVWIQLGIGVFLLVAPRGRWSRCAGLVSVGWGLVVWAFGEAFGGLFAPGVTWAFGAPGAVLFYAVAGSLVALPERAWRGPRLGRLLTASLGAYFLGMALLQAWPARGSWQGRLPHGGRGPLAAMAAAMAATHQPHVLAAWVSSFAAFDAAHGWGVNLFLVVALAAVGTGLCTGRRLPVLAATAGAAVLCLATWVLVQDVGMFGGVGTDPNSMVPTLLLVVGGVVALLRQPAAAPATGPSPAVAPAAAVAPATAVPAGAGGRWWEELNLGYAGRALAASAAVVVVLVGAVPMAAASTNPNADPIISQAVDGTPNLVDAPAPGFTLTDQHGQQVSFASLRGKAVALTFLDPVCSSACPLIAQEFRQADTMLGAQSARTEFVAVVANPIYHSVATVQAFDRQEGLTHVGNWLYLTGPVGRLRNVWRRYGIEVAVTPAGSMVAHGELAFVIDPQGHERAVLDDSPGTGPPAYSSFSGELDDQLRSVLAG